MILRALEIVKEEITRAKESTPRVRHPLLDALEEVIVGRIGDECVEVPKLRTPPEVLPPDDDVPF